MSWMDKIKSGEETPPLISNYDNGVFEINNDNPLFEALNRSGVTEHPIIIWITEEEDYDTFTSNYAMYVENNLK
jgi:hypothetical protein